MCDLIRDLTKLRRRRRRQRQRQKAIGLGSKTTTLHVHHAFLYISFPSLHDYNVKWPNFKCVWGRERQGDKFYHLFLLSNWATRYNRKMVWKDAESILQRGFRGSRCCRIVRSQMDGRSCVFKMWKLKGFFAVLVKRDFGDSSRPTGDVTITGIHCTRNLSDLHYTIFFL